MSSGLQAVYFVVSLGVTLYAAAVFARRLDRLGARFGLPEALLGLLTALAADAPELAAAIAAIAAGSKSVGLGVVVGSNVFNLGAMIGASALVAGSVRLRRMRTLALEGGVALGVAGAVCLLAFAVVPAWAALLIAAVLFAPYLLALGESEVHEAHVHRAHVPWRYFAVMPPAVAAIVLGSIGMVHSAVRLGHRAGMPQVLVGALLLAVLTSLPNAYTGVRLGRAGRGSALVSETMNSNTINLLGGIAVPAVVAGVGSFSGLVRADLIWLVVATALTIALLAGRNGLRRAGGVVLVLSWIAFAAVQGVFG